jgi:hypothetical protein
MRQDTAGSEAGEREQLLAEIEQNRQDLTEALRALAAKTDVSARVRQKTTQMRDRVNGSLTTEGAGKRSALYAAAGVCAAAGLLVLRRKRS